MCYHLADSKGAKEGIAEALAYAETTSGQKRIGALAFIASAQAEVGDIEGAKEGIAEALAYAKTQSGALRASMPLLIIKALAKME